MKSRSNLESFEIVRISAGSVTTTMSAIPGKYVRFMLRYLRLAALFLMWRLSWEFSTSSDDFSRVEWKRSNSQVLISRITGQVQS
jgi:hypothetical protein